MSALDIGMLITAIAFAVIVGMQLYKLIKSIRAKKYRPDDVSSKDKEGVENDRH